MEQSLEAAIAAAQEAMEQHEAAICVDLVELALWGIAVVPWTAPGPSAPICTACGRTGGWYQFVRTGIVRCRCAIPNWP